MQKIFFSLLSLIILFSLTNLEAKNSSLENLLKENPSSKSSSSKLSYEEALIRLKSASNNYKASQAQAQASLLEAQAYDSLRYPQVMAYSFWTRYSFHGSISFGKLSNEFNGIMGLLPNIPDLPLTSEHLRPFPNNYDFQIKESKYTNGLLAFMPIYEGGKISAVQKIARAKYAENLSKSEHSFEEENLELLKRYFGVQLAKKVLNVREIALKAVQNHYNLATNMLKVGLISKVEKLQADVALKQAQFEVTKAKDDLKFALSALNSMLKSSFQNLENKLFINSYPLPSLASFQSSSKIHNKIFKTIDAKELQALSYKDLQESEWKPKVMAFGARELRTNKAYWGFGLNATWKLFSNIDRKKMDEAAEENIKQVRAVKEQVSSDIDLLIEQKYLAVQLAKDQYSSLVIEVDFAKEIVKLRLAGFKEGLNTYIDLNTAQANLAKAQTQEAKAAYDYVIALSSLLEASGQLRELPKYIKNADIIIQEEDK